MPAMSDGPGIRLIRETVDNSDLYGVREWAGSPWTATA